VSVRADGPCLLAKPAAPETRGGEAKGAFAQSSVNGIASVVTASKLAIVGGSSGCTLTNVVTSLLGAVKRPVLRCAADDFD
jgi:hypothetical protein